MKKLVSLVLALAMLLPMFSTIALAEDPIELSIVVVRRDTDITETYDEKYWAQKVLEDLNIDLKFIEMAEADRATETATILAQSELPDIFMSGSAMNDTLVLANAGLWKTFTVDEIREKLPNAAAVYDKYIPDWESYLTYPDGNIYGLPSALNDSYMHTTDVGVMYINKTWLDNLNLAVPTTAEELLDVLRAFRDQDADGDGDTTNEIPFDFCEAFFASKIEFLAWMWGLPITADLYYKINDEGNVEGAVHTEEFRKFLEYANLMVTEGLMSVDGFTQTYEQWAANLNSMKVGCFFGWGPCNYISNKEDFLNITGIVTPHAEGYETAMYAANPVRSQRNGFIISKDCKNVDAALKLWNYFSDPQMALTVYCGPEGIAWEKLDDDWNWWAGAPKTEEETQKIFSEFGYGYEKYIGKTITGSNTLGYVNNGPLVPHGDSYDTSDLTAWGVQRYVTIQALTAADVFAPYMNKDIVPADKQEEFDFMTDGLSAMIKEFVAQSVKNGVTDDSWNQYLNDLNTYGYDFYVEFFNTKYHHGF